MSMNTDFNDISVLMYHLSHVVFSRHKQLKLK